jgi:hypothetical protein
MVTIFEAIIREGIEAGEFEVEDAAEAARAVNIAFMPFFHPILIEHCVQHDEDTEAGLRDQIRFILKALGKSPPAPTSDASRVTELDGQIDLRSAASHNRETLVFTQN